MNAKKMPTSIFSQKLDRIVYTAYFLGAVVPLVALAFVAEHFVLPSLTDRLAWVGLVGLVLSIGSLSLGSFFALRRTTHQTLDQMDRDNRRLGSLLKAAGAFANAQHEAEAAATAVRCALELTDADAVYAFVRGRPLEASQPSRIAGKGLGKAPAALRHSRRRAGEPRHEGGAPRPARTRGRRKGGARPPPRSSPFPAKTRPWAPSWRSRPALASRSAAEKVDALSTLAALASVSLRNSDLRDAQRNFFSHMTDLVVTALDAHLLHQNGHGNRVAQYANRVGRELDLDDRCLQRLHFSALLHDIGMLKIERALLDNAKACEKHPQIGARMLERIRLWEDVAPIVLHHHEWFDGTGYPEQLKGNAIPLESRIIARLRGVRRDDQQLELQGRDGRLGGRAGARRLRGHPVRPGDRRTIFKDLVERGVDRARRLQRPDALVDHSEADPEILALDRDVADVRARHGIGVESDLHRERFAAERLDARAHGGDQLRAARERQADARRVLEIELLAEGLHAVQDLAEETLLDEVRA